MKEIDLIIRRKVDEALNQISEETIERIINEVVTERFFGRFNDCSLYHTIERQVIENFSKAYVTENYQDLAAQIKVDAILTKANVNIAKHIGDLIK